MSLTFPLLSVIGLFVASGFTASIDNTLEKLALK